MPALIIIAVVCAIIGLSILSNRSQAQQLSALNTGGVLGRGLILQASSTISGRALIAGQRCEMRALVLDIELPGQPPYEVSVTPAIPRIVEALPGVAVDVRVDPNNPQNVSIVGPAGSSAWLPTALPLVMPTAIGVPTGSSGKGCGVVFLLASLGFAGLAVAAGLASSEAKPRGGYCVSAARCCKAANLTKCTKYESMSEKSCEPIWKGLKAQASKLHNKCD